MITKFKCVQKLHKFWKQIKSMLASTSIANTSLFRNKKMTLKGQITRGECDDDHNKTVLLN